MGQWVHQFVFSFFFWTRTSPVRNEMYLVIVRQFGCPSCSFFKIGLRQHNTQLTTPATTMGRLVSVCGNIGTREIASTAGCKIGPPPYERIRCRTQSALKQSKPSECCHRQNAHRDTTKIQSCAACTAMQYNLIQRITFRNNNIVTLNTGLIKNVSSVKCPDNTSPTRCSISSAISVRKPTSPA